MGISRHATAHWTGDLKSGRGALSTPQSGLMDSVRYGFNSRFGDEKGTNPEELLATAHAGCFSMALAAVMTKAGVTPETIQTRAEVTMEPGMDPGPTITGVNLVVTAKAPGVDEATFKQYIDAAKAGCVISRALSVPVTAQATLQG
jgi:lipoyl-dependent peroxiredoxin